jgi:hypothetical protein
MGHQFLCLIRRTKCWTHPPTPFKNSWIHLCLISILQRYQSLSRVTHVSSHVHLTVCKISGGFRGAWGAESLFARNLLTNFSKIQDLRSKICYFGGWSLLSGAPPPPFSKFLDSPLKASNFIWKK